MEDDFDFCKRWARVKWSKIRLQVWLKFVPWKLNRLEYQNGVKWFWFRSYWGHLIKIACSTVNTFCWVNTHSQCSSIPITGVDSERWKQEALLLLLYGKSNSWTILEIIFITRQLHISFRRKQKLKVILILSNHFYENYWSNFSNNSLRIFDFNNFRV